MNELRWAIFRRRLNRSRGEKRNFLLRRPNENENDFETKTTDEISLSLITCALELGKS